MFHGWHTFEYAGKRVGRQYNPLRHVQAQSAQHQQIFGFAADGWMRDVLILVVLDKIHLFSLSNDYRPNSCSNIVIPSRLRYIATVHSADVNSIAFARLLFIPVSNRTAETQLMMKMAGEGRAW